MAAAVHSMAAARQGHRYRRLFSHLPCGASLASAKTAAAHVCEVRLRLLLPSCLAERSALPPAVLGMLRRLGGQEWLLTAAIASVYPAQHLSLLRRLPPRAGCRTRVGTCPSAPDLHLTRPSHDSARQARQAGGPRQQRRVAVHRQHSPPAPAAPGRTPVVCAGSLAARVYTSFSIEHQPLNCTSCRCAAAAAMASLPVAVLGTASPAQEAILAHLSLQDK